MGLVIDFGICRKYNYNILNFMIIYIMIIQCSSFEFVGFCEDRFSISNKMSIYIGIETSLNQLFWRTMLL